MLKIKGLKKIAGESKNLDSGCHLQVLYDMKTCEAWADYHVGESWSVYNDDNVITCGRLYERATMCEIRQMIEFKVYEINNLKSFRQMTESYN